MRTFVLQPTVAALAAACIAVPGAVAPSAHAAPAGAGGAATTVDSVARVSVPQLRLVLAQRQAVAEVGATAAIALEPQFEILALPADAAERVAAEGVSAVPGAVVAQGREAAALMIGDVSLAAQALPTPATPLDVLGLPIQTALAIIAGINPPPTFPNPASYTSLYTVLNNAISVFRAPLAALLTGQFTQLVTQTSAAWATFVTSATVGLPASISASLAYIAEVLASAFGTVAAPAPAATVSTAAAASATALPTPPTALDLLGLPIQTALAVVAGINPPPTFPNPASYTSVYTVINNAISVFRAPLAALLTGQFTQVATQTAAAWATFTTSLTVGLPASVSASVAYAGEVIAAVLGGAPAAAAATAEATVETAVETAVETRVETAVETTAADFHDVGAPSPLAATATATVESLTAVQAVETDPEELATPADADVPAADAASDRAQTAPGAFMDRIRDAVATELGGEAAPVEDAGKPSAEKDSESAAESDNEGSAVEKDAEDAEDARKDVKKDVKKDAEKDTADSAGSDTEDTKDDSETDSGKDTEKPAGSSRGSDNTE